MQIRMLGPLEVHADGAAVPVAGGRLRRLLILLALEPGRVVSSARLVDGIWGEEPPAGAANALQALVSRLRRAVPQLTVESHPTGYRLVIEPDAVDVGRFERMVAAGRSAGDPASAAHLLREALSLWRGPALLDVADTEFFQAPVARLAELRLGAVEDRVDADLRLGRGAGLVTELTSLVAEHPLRERLVGALMRALSSAGRPAEALTVYERTREALADGLGTDPSPELSALHTAALRGELNPTSAADGTKTNLRAWLTSFIGRDEDVTRVGKLLGEYRLVTLTGPGGSGKTRLAVEAAGAMRDQLTDGVWLVELAPATGVDVAQAVASAIGLRDQTRPGVAQAGEPADRLISALRNRSALLVLDNCEHVIDAAATLAERLLGDCPRLRILATSREPLGITGEALWPVEPLALPPANAGLVEAMSYASVRLLVDRAAAARPGFEATEDVVRICRALDGMPLAIELAAARLRTMSAAQLAGRLDDRFRLLTSGARTALPRHQTLRAMVDWSWELLAEDERAQLRRLALFSGGATAEAAERVCGANQALLDSLTDKSLLVTSGDGRYRMLETIKAYGLERLDEAGEREKIRAAHAAYFAELTETAEPHLRRAEQLVWLDRLNADHDNITAALRGAVAAGDANGAVRLAAAAGWYWWLAGYRTEGTELVGEALAVPGADAVHDETLAIAYAIAALFATSGLGDEREVGEILRKVQRLAVTNDFSNSLLRFLGPMGELLRASSEGTEPKLEVLDPLLVDEDPWLRAQARVNRARLLVNIGGRQAEARADIETALAEYRVIGERWGISFALTVLADLLAQSGDLAAAHTHYGEAIAVVTEVGTTEDVLPMRARQAQLRWLLGDPAGSAAAMAEAEREARRVTWPDGIAGMAYAKAELARWQGEPAVANEQLARAEGLVRHIVVHPVVTAMLLGSRAYLEDDLDTARAYLAEALDLALASMHAPTIALVLVGVADLALRQGKPDEAAALSAASVAVRGGPDLANHDAVRVEQAARAALGDDFAGAAQRGRDATRETVRDIASVTLGD